MTAPVPEHLAASVPHEVRSGDRSKTRPWWPRRPGPVRGSPSSNFRSFRHATVSHRNSDHPDIQPGSVGSVGTGSELRAGADPSSAGVDHLRRPQPELVQRCEEHWGAGTEAGFPIVVVPNRFEQSQVITTYERAHGSKRRFGAGWNRNTGAELARGDILVFLDDDAAAEPSWLEYLLAPFDDPRTVAVGGAPLPRYETERPRWFPANFDWVFGCASAGLPTELGPYPRLIGANMSVRRESYIAVGDCRSIDFDDLDLCLRLSQKDDPRRLMYEPRAVVHHFVPRAGVVEVLLASLLLRQSGEGRGVRRIGRYGEHGGRKPVRHQIVHRPTHD